MWEYAFSSPLYLKKSPPRLFYRHTEWSATGIAPTRPAIIAEKVPGGTTGLPQADSARRDKQRNELAEVHGNRTNIKNTEESRNSIQSGAESGVVGAHSGEIGVNLWAIIDAWPMLSESTKAEILAIVGVGD